MPDPDTNKFLTKFAKDNHGQIWKATSETSLMQVWESVATGMDYSYILTYVFPPPNVPQPVVMVFDEAALFDFDKADLKPAGKDQIKAYTEEAKAELSRADKIKISGHTDNVGKAEYNMTLSQKRAEAVSDYLKSIGVDPNKMEVMGEGMSRPVADNRTKEGRAKNRRVEVEVHGIEK
jgi:OOP family OmpA-OmpF porin